MITVNERVYELRKELSLTLEKFGNNLGVTKTAISKIEKGERKLTEQMIKAICNADWNGNFVNEQWLRTGEGSMFEELPPEDEYFKAATQLSDDPDVRSVLIAFWRQDEEGKKAIKKFLKDIIAEFKNQDNN